MAANIPDSVKRCVAILKAASSDTEKFAALFMVTKLTKSGELDAVSKKVLFEAIGFKFLKRLLLCRDVPEDCPPLVYKSVALSILSAFCAEEELATHPEMLHNIPLFLDIVQQADADDYDDNLIVISEAYECLQHIAAYDPGQKALFEVGTVSKMSEIYSHQSFQTDEALNILVTLVKRFGPASWDAQNPKPFHGLVTKMALDFETDHSERKFELCEILIALLSNCQRDSVAATASEECWPGCIHKGLNDILTSKIGKAQRDPALKLASAIVEVLGIEWCLTDEEKPKTFFLLLIQLCSVEVRMQLEDRSLKQIIDNAGLLTACFMLIESAISFIAADTIDLEQKEKQQIYTALKGAFSAVITVLTKVSQDFSKNKDSLGLKEKIFVCAMIRVLGAWLAQETSAMRNAVYGILPFVLFLANDTFYAYRSRYVSEKVRAESKSSNTEVDCDPLSQIDILRLMLPALMHLTVEDKGRQIMLEVKEEEVLLESMAFHWSIVHYKKPPVPKSERNKVRTGPEPELPPKLLADMKDSRVAMLCNIITEKYQLPSNFASHACTTFLQNFRLCPHNPELNIAEWRILLWREALKEHARIAEEVYLLWFKLRYENLAMSHDVTSMLKKLRHNYNLGLITNGTSSSQWEKVMKLNLMPYFDCIIVSGDYPWEKPHQNIFLEACKLLGTEPHNCVMVGDKLETDILGGKEANFAATVWISDSPRQKTSHFHPDFTLTSVTELPNLLSLLPDYPDLDDSNSNSSDGS